MNKFELTLPFNLHQELKAFYHVDDDGVLMALEPLVDDCHDYLAGEFEGDWQKLAQFYSLQARVVGAIARQERRKTKRQTKKISFPTP